MSYRGGGSAGRPVFNKYGECEPEDHEDDYLTFVERNNRYQQQRSAVEDEVYRRIQQAKANRGRPGEGAQKYRTNGSGGYRTPPPPPKQNGNGKNSKHFFWPHPDHNNNHNYSNSNNNNSSNNNNKKNTHGAASSKNHSYNYNYDSNNYDSSSHSNSAQRSKSKSVQVAFSKATALSDSVMRDQVNGDNDDDDDASEDDSSDDLINRGIDSDDESDEEFLMQQFNWIEEDSTPAPRKEEIQEQSGNNSAQQQQQQQQPQHQSMRQQKKPTTIYQPTASVEVTPDLCLNSAMTQSEDFMQDMEAEGDIKVHADEIEDLSTSMSALAPTAPDLSAHTINEMNQVFSSTLELSQQDGALLESRTEVITQVLSLSTTNSQGIASPQSQADPQSTAEKPKKKAHRSKRGGVKQRERQMMNKQMIVGNDDDGPMYLEDLSDEEDDAMLALEDYVQNTKDAGSLNHLESLLGALKGLHGNGREHRKNLRGMDLDNSDYEQQISDDSDQDDNDSDNDDFDFEEDYEDGVKKLDFRKVSISASDKRKTRRADDLLRDELLDLMPLWQSGVLRDGDGANRRFKSRAKGYDLYDSDDGFMVPSSAGGKKKNKNKNKKEPHGGSFDTLMDINSQIEDFVRDRTVDSLTLPPMPKPLRRKVHYLCNYYNIQSQSVGSNKRRFPVLIKTDRTKMPINPVNINKLLNQSQEEMKEYTRLSAQFQGTRKGGNGNGNGGGKGKGKGRGFGGGGGGGSQAAPHGTVVGATASEISVENLGHRMLSKMGWLPGVGLGATGEGITQPIEAIMRAKHRGLGHE
ncbi:hypothetical protein BGZ98_004436 [Dissophora globulifera]|nr:hypothetical protein BGZ98_004436 [Dissophora globulifera]